MKRKIIIKLVFTGLSILIASLCFAAKQKDESRLSVVVIDPGHGGKDPGATVKNAREKDIVLDIAKRLGNKIKTQFPDVQVVYTRDRDVFIPLYQRAVIANKNKADLFISIHANAVGRTSAMGTESFVLGNHRSKDNLEIAKKENSVILLEEDYTRKYEDFDPNSDESYIMFELIQSEYFNQSVQFASAVQDEFRTKADRVDRSVKQAGFLVLRSTTMPSVLIEAGFISNSDERNYLTSDKGKEQIATSIFSAFKNYKKKIEEKSSFNLVTQTLNNNTSKNTPETNTEKDTSKQIKKKKENPVEPVVIGDIYFSVQIAASKKNLETTPFNFKGEERIFKNRSGDIYRYFSGKYNTYEHALEEKTRLQNKFGGAFIVAFEHENIISVKKARGKM